MDSRQCTSCSVPQKNIPSPLHRLWYCSSVTCSIQSTTLPSSFSWIAMCVTDVVGDAPCQCFSPGSNHTTSPGRISSIAPPSRCTHPAPAVTIRVCPRGCVCHTVRAPGSNVTLAPVTKPGSGAANSGSTRTVPVNQSAGPFVDACVPTRVMFIDDSPSSSSVKPTATTRSIYEGLRCAIF